MLSNLKKSLFLTITLFLLAACSLVSTKITSEPINQPVTSPADKKIYSAFTLENGLTALVISDPDAEKAAASVNVAAGSYHEPDEHLGLAHYLEHLLFLGTENHPEPDAYQKFISQHGGSHNAFTASRVTNYFFDIQPDYLEEGLSRLSEFFISPLFNSGYLDRELNAVHAEFSGTLNNDGRLKYQAMRQAFNPKHPAARFSAGNKHSLNLNDPSLLVAIQDFYANYYQPTNLSLVISGPQSVEQLTAMAKNSFSQLTNGKAAGFSTKNQLVIKEEANWPSLFAVNSLPKLIEYQPIKTSYQLEVHFPLPDQKANYQQKAINYLAHLLGEESETSLLAHLKQLGWANALAAGGHFATGKEMLFSLSLDLTPAGSANKDQVLAMIFAQLEKIQQEGINKWRYAEIAQLAEQNFNFAENTPAVSQVIHLATQLKHYPIKDLISQAYLYKQFDERLIRQLAQELTPENMLVIHTSPEIEPQQQEKWLGAKYNLKTYQLAKLNPELGFQPQLPTKNTFIADNFKLEKTGKLQPTNNQQQPEKIYANKGIESWQGISDRFNQPKAATYISLQNPQVTQELNQRLLAQLAAKWLNNQLNAPAYPARLAGLDYSIYAHSRGLTLHLSGFNQQQPRLAKLMLEELLAAKVDAASFERLKNQLVQQLANQQVSQPVQQLVNQLHNQLLTPSWSLDEQLAVANQLTTTDLANFLAEFKQQLYVQVFTWGNLSKEANLELTRLVEETLKPKLTAADVPLLTVKQLIAKQPSQSIKKQQVKLKASQDTAVFHYVQGVQQSAANNLTQEAAQLLALQLQKSEFFHRLRTEQQLGYAVYAASLPLITQQGSFYFVQAPNHSAEEVNAAISKFLQEDLYRLKNLSAEEFSQNQHSLAQKLIEKPNSLSEEASRYWQEIGLQRYAFDQRQQLASAVEELSQEEVVRFYQQQLNNQLGQLVLLANPQQQQNANLREK